MSSKNTFGDSSVYTEIGERIEEGNAGNLWVSFEDHFEIEEFYSEVAEDLEDKILIADSIRPDFERYFGSHPRTKSLESEPYDLNKKEIEIVSTLENIGSFIGRSSDYDKEDIFLIYEHPTLAADAGFVSQSDTEDFLYHQFKRAASTGINALYLDVALDTDEGIGAPYVDVVDYETEFQ